jgi:hypothetical protein
MTNGVWTNCRSLAYVDLTWDLDTGQSVFTLAVIITVTFAFNTRPTIAAII